MNEPAVVAMQNFLTALGLEANDKNLRQTPKRVAKMYESLFDGIKKSPKEIWGDQLAEGDGSLVAVRHIPFLSICEHHLMPFFGEVNIVYLPSERGIAGFGKFVELVRILSHRPQLQERLTGEIATAVMDGLYASGVLVTIKAQQLCLLVTGQSSSDVQTVTFCAQGLLKCGSAWHQAALSLLNDKRYEN